MIDLDDEATYLGEYSARLLSIARSGALIRTLQRGPLPLDRVADAEAIGSCAVLISDSLHPTYGDVLARLVAELGVPFVAAQAALSAADTFPRAADAVVLVGVTGSEPTLVTALHHAGARGALVVVAAPKGSPLAVAATDRRAVLASFEPDAESIESAWWAAYAACAATWRGSGVLADLADALDDAASAVGPIVPTYDNVAKQIAELSDSLLLIVTDGASDCLGLVLAAELGADSHRTVRVVDARRGLGEFATIAQRSASGGARDLFYDPELDGKGGGEKAWQLVLLPTVEAQDLAADAVRAAETYGSVLAPVYSPRQHNDWVSAQLVVLGRLIGAYDALKKDEQE